MATDQSVLATQPTNVLSVAETAALIEKLTSGVNDAAFNRKVNVGKLIAFIADANGTVLQEAGPLGGTMPAVIVGMTTWQFADAIHAKLRTLAGAAKFSAYKWNDKEGQYTPARSTIVNGKQVGDEGAIEQYVRRHAGMVAASVYPGVSELQVLSKAAAEQAATAKKNKGSFAPDTADHITRVYAAAMRAMGVERAAALTSLRTHYPELYAPKQS